MLDIKELIKKILISFEQSSTTIKYNKIYEWEDGPNRIKQITVSFGITEYGNLKKLIQSYCNNKGMFTEQFLPFIELIGKTPLVSDKTFKKLLVIAGDDPVMQKAQNDAFNSMYIDPAMEFCEKNKIQTNLGKLVISDSYLHSGSILKLLRNRFSESVPVNGGDEKKWVEAYCKTRRDWLKNHSNTDLNKTVYRMDFMLDRIKNGDWNLIQSPFNANGVKVTV